MAAPNPAKPFALDTNVLLSLARGAEAIHEFREEFQAHHYLLRLSPTVLREAQWLENNGTSEERRLASIAIRKIPAWGLQPFRLEKHHELISIEFARRLIYLELLPPEERNDGRILAESSLAQIPILATRDHHLLDIDQDALGLAFSDAGLPIVRAAHPADLLRALRRVG